jgi:N-acyl-D-amino-acid deacylase
MNSWARPRLGLDATSTNQSETFTIPTEASSQLSRANQFSVYLPVRGNWDAPPNSVVASTRGWDGENSFEPAILRGMFRILASTFLGLVCGAAVRSQPLDLLLTNGKIVDGAGNPWYPADVGIRNGRIAVIGMLKGRQAARTLDVQGQVIAPGFIDMMGGSSSPLLRDPASGQSKLRQGITTMFAGEGSSEAPRGDEPAVGGYRWHTFGEYFAILERQGIPLNVLHNVGAAQIRRLVIGVEDRAPTAAELDRMRTLVDEAMRDGAAGLSTALIYPPGIYARTAELVAMAEMVGRYGGIYSTHMRNESSKLLEAIGESMKIGEKAGVPVHIYHLKAAGQENWPLMAKAIEKIQQARDRGQDVTADIYPYIRNGLGLSALVHPRHFAAGADAFLPKLADAEIRTQLRREIENTSDWENWYRHAGSDWESILIAQANDKALEGKSIAGAAKARGEDAWTTFFELVKTGGVSVNPKSMNEEQKHLALRTTFVSFCTDASPTNIETTTGAHPRAFGSFPRVIAQYVRQDRVIGLEEAIRKMTSLAANRLSLFDRGLIAVGMAADLVVFDPARIQDTASFTKPLAFPEGISHVLVNGQVAVENGHGTPAMAGQVLRHGLRQPRPK